MIYVGIDVGQSACALVFLHEEGVVVDSDWTTGDSVREVVQAVCSSVERVRGTSTELAIAIDAPRQSLPRPRQWYWDAKRGDWRARRKGDKGLGRHCEVVVAALKLARPQWTPLRKNAPAWMRVGFRLFEDLAGTGRLYEVFPTASYKQLRHDREVSIRLNFANFAFGPKDMLDACIAAATAREYILGRGAEVGGGDGLGTIVLPRAIEADSRCRVFQWPSADPK